MEAWKGARPRLPQLQRHGRRGLWSDKAPWCWQRRSRGI